MFDDYFIAVEEANNPSDSFENDNIRKTSVLLLAQTVATVLNIFTLIYYVYEINTLCL